MNKLKTFLKLIKFEHSIFALPFAYLGLFLASNGWPTAHTFIWVTVAMIGVRTSAMCLNRLIDEPIDRENPRTRDRITSLESLTHARMWILTVASIVLFVVASAKLNPLCLKLSPIPIALVWLYPHLKKFTWASHFALGLVLGLAPYGGWLAASPQFSWIPALLTLAVCTWVSGFDMFYALQDEAFDRDHHLKSFPVRFGDKTTSIAVAVLHGVTVLALALLGIVLHLGVWYWLGWLGVLGLIAREHWIVLRYGLSRINEAFFNMNAWVSIVIFAAVMLDLSFR